MCGRVRIGIREEVESWLLLVWVGEWPGAVFVCVGMGSVWEG